jgi:hypothetical protein
LYSGWWQPSKERLKPWVLCSIARRKGARGVCVFSTSETHLAFFQATVQSPAHPVVSLLKAPSLSGSAKPIAPTLRTRPATVKSDSRSLRRRPASHKVRGAVLYVAVGEFLPVSGFRGWLTL